MKLSLVVTLAVFGWAALSARAAPQTAGELLTSTPTSEINVAEALQGSDCDDRKNKHCRRRIELTKYEDKRTADGYSVIWETNQGTKWAQKGRLVKDKKPSCRGKECLPHSSGPDSVDSQDSSQEKEDTPLTPAARKQGRQAETDATTAAPSESSNANVEEVLQGGSNPSESSEENVEEVLQGGSNPSESSETNVEDVLQGNRPKKCPSCPNQDCKRCLFCKKKVNGKKVLCPKGANGKQDCKKCKRHDGGDGDDGHHGGDKDHKNKVMIVSGSWSYDTPDCYRVHMEYDSGWNGFEVKKSSITPIKGCRKHSGLHQGNSKPINDKSEEDKNKTEEELDE